MKGAEASSGLGALRSGTVAKGDVIENPAMFEHLQTECVIKEGS